MSSQAQLDELFSQLYNKIRALASRVQWNGVNPTLNPTALAHEAYLKLLNDPPDLASKSYGEVAAVFANAMRQILIDGARRRSARTHSHQIWPERKSICVEEALALDEALDELKRENPLRSPHSRLPLPARHDSRRNRRGARPLQKDC